MTETAKYNGWTNYETWAVKLWLDNEEPAYRYWLERTTEHFNNAKADNYFTHKERATISLADELKDQITETDRPELQGVYADLLGAALSEVNWYEIAKAMIEDAG